LRRFSWSAVLYIMFLFAFVGRLLELGNRLRRDIEINEPLSIPVQALNVQAFAPAMAAHLKPGAAFGGADTLFIFVEKPTTRQHVLDALTRYPLAVGSVIVFFLLWRLLARARNTDTFTAGTVRRMRVLAALVLLGGLAAELVTDYAKDALVRTVADNDVWAADSHLTLPWLLPGLALLAGAEVLNIGQKMRAELAEVI
jgi:hypothetical protein